MSLINEALKRAQEAQEQATRREDRNLELRPVEPANPPRRGSGWVLPSVVTAAVLLAAFCIYQALRPLIPPAQVQARTTARTPQPHTIPNVPAPGPETASSRPTVSAIPNISATSPAPPPAREQSAPAFSPEHATSNSVATSPAAPDVTPSPQLPARPALRLQGIVAHPTRPSAVINGKTVFVGDKLGDKRVVAIDSDTVTLGGSGQTNVLTLP